MNARAHLEKLFEAESVRAFNNQVAQSFIGIDGWMDPTGKLHRAPTESHDTWASRWLRARDPVREIHDPTADMYQLGWVRVVFETSQSARELYVSHGFYPPNRAQLAEAEYFAIERNAILITDGPTGSRTVYRPPAE